MVGNGYADVKKVEGNTIVWNQLVSNGDTEKTISTTQWSAAVYSVPLVREANHYFYIRISSHDATTDRFLIANSSNNIYYSGYFQFTNDVYSNVVKITTRDSDQSIYILRYSGENVVTVHNFMIIDLTRMFGETVANSMTVEEFERLFPMEYAPYCEGRLVSLGGYGIKWNQLVQNGDFSDGTTGWASEGTGTTFTVSNGEMHIVSTTPNKAVYQQISSIVKGHKYYVAATGKETSSSSSYTVRLSDISPLFSFNNIIYTRKSAIYIADTSYIVITAYSSSATSGDAYIRDVVCVDLTEMFGPGSEPTIEEFEAMFGTEYRPYDEGTEMNILQKMELQDDLSVKSTGFNLWDEEWEKGYFYVSDGILYYSTNANTIRSKNYIPVFPNTTYFGRTSSGHSFYRVASFDTDKNFISIIVSSGMYPTLSFTTPSNCHYIKFFCESYNGDYQNDICINLSDPAKNGTYLPYTTSTQNLNWIYDLEYTPSGSTTPEKLFPYGLLSAGTVHDEITDTGAVKRVGTVDLGTLTWMYDDNDAYFYATMPSGTKLGPVLEMICSAYVAGGRASTTVMATAPKGIYYYNEASYTMARIKDITYTDAIIFQSAMQGVLLYYELATPITITFPTTKDLGYNVQSGGTEELLPINPANAGPVTAPIKLSVNYPLDAVGTLTNLPKNYISVESMDSFTTALGNTLNLNITKTWDSTNNKWTFSVTSRS